RADDCRLPFALPSHHKEALIALPWKSTYLNRILTEYGGLMNKFRDMYCIYEGMQTNSSVHPQARRQAGSELDAIREKLKHQSVPDAQEVYTRLQHAQAEVQAQKREMSGYYLKLVRNVAQHFKGS